MDHDTRQLILVVLLGVLRRFLLNFIDNSLSFFLSLLFLGLLNSLTLAEPLRRVRFHVDLKGELEVLVNLYSDHLVVVEFEALQWEHHEARQSLDALPFKRVYLLVTLLAVVGILTLKHLTLDRGEKTLLERLLILYGDWNGQEILRAVVLVWAALANHLVCVFATKVLLYSILLRRSLDSGLNPVHEHIEELFDVHLLKDICRVAVPVLESMTEAFGIHILLLRLKEASEEQLQLVEHVLILFLLLILGDAKDVISKTLNHEQLLEKRIHVTDASEVLDTYIACARFLTIH